VVTSAPDMPERVPGLPGRSSADARRRQILDAAIWTFARKGYRNTSIRDIIDRAAVARGTFYLYYDSKEQVFLAIVNDFHDRLVLMLEEPERAIPLAEHTGPARLQRVLRRWLDFFASHRDQAAVVLKEAGAIDARFEDDVSRLRELGVRYFASRFERLQGRGLVTRALEPTVMALLQIGMLDGVVRERILADTEVDVEALAAQLASFAWHGMRPE
jgi:AcrR family transcriptional regulator